MHTFDQQPHIRRVKKYEHARELKNNLTSEQQYC